MGALTDAHTRKEIDEIDEIEAIVAKKIPQVNNYRRHIVIFVILSCFV